MNKSTTITFLSGFLTCALIFSLYSFKDITNLSFIGEDVIQADQSVANQYRANYKNSYPSKPYANSVSISQLDAMNQIVSEVGENNIKGLRMYHGLTSSGTRVSCVYTLDLYMNEPSNGSTGRNSMVTMGNNVSSNFTDQCPPLCD